MFYDLENIHTFFKILLFNLLSNDHFGIDALICNMRFSPALPSVLCHLEKLALLKTLISHDFQEQYTMR